MTPAKILLLIFAAAVVGIALYIILDGMRCASRKVQLDQQRRDRRTRINAKAPEHGIIFAPGHSIALNAEDALPELIQLAPFGRWPTRDKKTVQVFNAESAAQVVSWFDFWPRKIARLANINSVKVWVGHPDFAPAEWPERIELGSITALTIDEHGLNGRVEWNAGAVEHVRKHNFPSVAWDCEVNADGTETPALLWSVGMWHKPNIKSVQPVINAAGDEPEEDPAEEPKTEAGMLSKIMEAFKGAGIIKEGDDENTVLGAIGSLIQTLSWKREEMQRQDALATSMRTALNALSGVAELPDAELPAQVITQLNAKIAEVTTLTQRVAELNAARIDAAIERALETGRITKADEEVTRTELNADYATALEKLTARPLQLNTAPLNLGTHKPAITEASERITRLNAWCDAYQAKHSCDFQTAWNASEADNEMKAVHAAMKQADEARSQASQN